MFVFRVKHLLLACFISVLFLYLSSNPESNKIPIQTQPERKDGIARDPSPHNDDVKGSDAVERYIDRYINKSEDDFILNSAAGGTTEESFVYLYVDNDSNVSNATEKDNDNDSEETKAQVYNEALDYPRAGSHLENVSDLFSNSRINDNEISVDENEFKIRSQENESFLSGEKYKFSTPENDQSWPNPTAEFILREQNNVDKGTSSKDSQEAGLSRSIAKDPETLPASPSINKEQQKQMKKDSPIVILRRDSNWPPVLQPSDAELFSLINYTKYDLEDRAYLVGRVGVYEERARVVGEVCRNNPHLIALSPTHTFVWDQRHDPNIVWCEISKVASTSWMVNFLRLGHYRENDTSLNHLPQEEKDAIRFESKLEDDNLHFKVLRLFPAPNTTLERRQVFSRALRFIIVRHPFSRLLSAYQDKMTTLNPIPRSFNFRQLQIDIIKRYRGNKTLQDDIDPQFPTFSEFIQYVIDSTANLKTFKDWRKVVCWQPYWVKCGVCAHDFQMIVKLETMVDDEHFLVTLAGLQELDKVFEWRHSRQSTKPKEEFFKQLSTTQMQLLHQRYLLDFQMFGYSIHQYLHLAFDTPKQNY